MGLNNQKAITEFREWEKDFFKLHAQIELLFKDHRYSGASLGVVELVRRLFLCSVTVVKKLEVEDLKYE